MSVSEASHGPERSGKMQKIPTEGKFCGDCPCIPENPYRDNCQLYPTEILSFNNYIGDYERLPQCLSDKPQILTWQERQALRFPKGLKPIDLSKAKPLDCIGIDPKEEKGKSDG